MKDRDLSNLINLVTMALVDEINREQDINRNCRLQNAQELLRRAFMEVESLTCELNDLIKI